MTKFEEAVSACMACLPETSLIQFMKDIKTAMIKQAIAETKNTVEAGKRLGVARTTMKLYVVGRKLKQKRPYNRMQRPSQGFYSECE